MISPLEESVCLCFLIHIFFKGKVKSGIYTRMFADKSYNILADFLINVSYSVIDFKCLPRGRPVKAKMHYQLF
jgi:hypothetical protein